MSLHLHQQSFHVAALAALQGDEASEPEHRPAEPQYPRTVREHQVLAAALGDEAAHQLRFFAALLTHRAEGERNIALEAAIDARESFGLSLARQAIHCAVQALALEDVEWGTFHGVRR